MTRILFFAAAIIDLASTKLLFTLGYTAELKGALLTSIFLLSGLTLLLATFVDSKRQAKLPLGAALFGTFLGGQAPWVGLSLAGHLGNGMGGVELGIGLFFGAIAYAGWVSYVGSLREALQFANAAE